MTSLFRVSTLSLLLATVACGGDDPKPDNGDDDTTDSDDESNDGADEGDSDGTAVKDAGKGMKDATVTPPAKDAGAGDGGSKDGGATADAGKGLDGSVADAGKDAGSDAGNGKDAGNTADAGKDAGKDSGDNQSKPDSGSSTPNKCENLVCIDVFDCTLWHPDALDCGFTRCDGLVCKK